MNPLDIIKKYYDPQSQLYNILVDHSQDVTNLALDFAAARPDLNLDVDFIREAAMLHDIGIFKCDAAGICCEGTEPYICHGFLGADIMRAEGYERHALVCERHTGLGLSLQYIIDNNLPLPHRDMQPVSLEEQVICFADKFFSKSHLGRKRSVEDTRSKLTKFGDVSRFDLWVDMFINKVK